MTILRMALWTAALGALSVVPAHAGQDDCGQLGPAECSEQRRRAAEAEKAGDPQCKICPCDVREAAPAHMPVHVSVKTLLDASMSMVCRIPDSVPRCPSPAEDLPANETSHCRAPARFQALGASSVAGAKSPPGNWIQVVSHAIDAAGHTSDAVTRKITIGPADGSPTMFPSGLPAGLKEEELHDRFSHVATYLLDALLDAVRSPEPGGPCHPRVVILVSDGLDHVKGTREDPLHCAVVNVLDALDRGRPRSADRPSCSKYNAMHRNRALEAKIETLVAEMNKPPRKVVRVLFARTRPVSQGDHFSNTAHLCDALSELATGRAVDVSCQQEELEGVRAGEPALDPGAVCKSDVERYVTGSSAKLEEMVKGYLKGVAHSAWEQCRDPVKTWEVARTRPLEPADAVLTGTADKWTCSGVVVAEDAVLTAAHCLPLSRVLVTDDLARGGAVHEVAASVRHPASAVDVALVRTRSRISVKPATLRAATDTEGPTGVLRFVGFGVSSGDGQSGFGKRHLVDLQASGWSCDGSRTASTGCKPGIEMVVPGSAGNDTCFGDSGGPIYELWGDGQSCGFRAVGLVARRTADSQVACGNGGVYTRIDAIRGWVDQQLKQWAGARPAERGGQ